MRNRADRQRSRYLKGMRRTREDRAQHGAERSCLCFANDGRTFARFADTPKQRACVCCGNPRRHFGDVTVQERRAPRIEDWQ